MSEKTPIAVVAMSGVFPGATGMDAFWRNIVDKVDATVDVSLHRWAEPLDWIYDRLPSPDKAYSKKACLIADDWFENLKECQGVAALADPLYRWVLHAAGDALDRCDIRAIDPHRMGAILAAIVLPTRSASDFSRKMMAAELSRSLFAPGAASISTPPHNAMSDRVVSSPAAVVCNAFGLGGTAYTLDAACASSLYALKLACDELHFRRADAMITGGVSGADCLYTQIGFSQLRALSPSGRCAPFDHSADGLVVGEGAGILVLKRLEDALRDRDTVFGVIRGIGLSNDMRGNLLAPESSGQLRAMQEAYAEAGWVPWDVQYIECHGAGTPVGDATELKSLRALWKDAPPTANQCAIGSVKSMIGHLLTAAGAAGMIKTLSALHHRTLPPSLKFEQAAPGSPLIDSPFVVQTDALPWPQVIPGQPRRAAVSAFGFGGINGHVLIEEWPEQQSLGAPAFVREVRQLEAKIPQPFISYGKEDVAIVGMDVCLGACTSLSAFRRTVFEARSILGALPENRWKAPHVMREIFSASGIKGAFLQEIVAQVGEFQIPPDELPDILPQQLLMLKVAAGAMQDAGLPLREPRERMGVTIGIGFDFEATNFHLRWVLPQLAREWTDGSGLPVDKSQLADWLEAARQNCGHPLTASRTLGALGGIVASRIAREFRFGGPSFVLSAEEASGLRAMEIAVRMLQSRQTDAMLVGAVDLTCDERNLVSLFEPSEISASGRVRPFDADADGTLPGEGAVALVLKRMEDAKAAGERIYAVIKGIGGAHGAIGGARHPSPAAYRSSLAQAMAESGSAADAISLIETHGSAIPDEDDVESEALHTFFNPSGTQMDAALAISALKPLVGHTGSTSGLASMVKTALCLHHHLLPAMPDFHSPKNASWRGGFHFPQQTNYWAADSPKHLRSAVVAAMTRDGNCMHAVLEQSTITSTGGAGRMEARDRRPSGPLPFALFVIDGMDRVELETNLDRLEQIARKSPSETVETLGRLWFSHHPLPRESLHTLSIVARSTEDLQMQLLEARRAIQEGIERLPSSRGGICYLPDGELKKGRTAFVFPGSGNHYLGMGRTLGAHWPEILRAMDAGTERLKSQMLPHLYDPWRTDWREGWQIENYRLLVADPLHTIFGQVIFGGQMSRLLHAFGQRPDAVIGYSLGESAGLFALGAWPDHGQMLDRLAASELFKNQLRGSCEALRKAWGIPAQDRIEWSVAVVNRPAEQVDRAVERNRYVRRLIVNTPNECVIGGLKEHVAQVIGQLACEALFLDGVVTVHCDAAQPAAEAYKELHRFPTTRVDGVCFYSCAHGAVYDLTSEAAADSILSQALYGFDFAGTIRQAYADGVRLFVEIGPQASCTRMIRQILDDRPDCLAVAANTRGEDESLTLLKCLGTLAAAGRYVDLSPLYGYPEHHFQDIRPVGANAIRVPVGGAPLRLAPLPLMRRRAEMSGRESRITQLPVTAPPMFPEDQAVSLEALDPMIETLTTHMTATAQAHEQFLALSRKMTEQFGEAFQLQNQLIEMLAGLDQAPGTVSDPVVQPSPAGQVAFTREQCLEFAVGSVGKLFGPLFDGVDSYKCRVRLPDEPLMLVDRILHIEGEMVSLGSGRVITEHDVLPGAWYLDGGRAPVCIAVEAGQADLFLSSYLGIDHQVKGERAYRLLDARIEFHRGLPRAGETVRYDIHIDKFVRQGATYLFFFRFEGYIGNTHLMTMTHGCAGFFTEQEVRRSGGIILADEDRAPGAVVGGAPFAALLPLDEHSFDSSHIEALRRGDAGACFGPDFAGVHLPPSLRLPGGRMRLIDRVVSLIPQGGRWNLGYIKAEADIHPDDWFLTCHFVDDMVMPGTLMYECCAHTLRVLLLRLGWVTHDAAVCYEPVPGLPCRLKCRGPVTPQTRHVHYAVEIKEIGYRPEPYVLADAHMYADGHYIVFFKDMSMQMSGVTRREIEDFWLRRKEASDTNVKEPLFTRRHILEFALGRPSQAYGERYAPFDSERRIARLPAPPYCFIDRITAVEPEPWVLKADGWIEAQYDLAPDQWYYAADRSGVMPYCILLEIALQPCGWLAAYAGSALKSSKDLKFRNLGGHATLHRNLVPEAQTLTMRSRIDKVSEAADMIIEHFEFEVLDEKGPVYTGDTYFGFFTEQALSQQVGLRDTLHHPGDVERVGVPIQLDSEPPFEPDESSRGRIFHPQGLQMPAGALLMLDAIDICIADGGPHKLGYVRGQKRVDSSEWFFKAHFYQDPVCPGSLGIESFLQLLKYAAMKRWPECVPTHRYEMVCGRKHQWEYRGQVIPSNHTVIVEAVITRIEEGLQPVMMADGWLKVDGRYIYKMYGYGLKLVKLEGY